MSENELPYECVLFDWDGCLVQSIEGWMDAYKRACAAYGLFPTESEIAAQFGDWDGPSRLGVPNDSQDDYIALLLTFVNANLSGVSLYPGALDLLEELRQSALQVAVVTNCKRENIAPAIEHLELAHLLDEIVTADDVSRHKPHADPIHEALRRLKRDTTRVVMVGDSRNDVVAATNAGVDSILLHPPSHAIYFDLEALMQLDPTHVCTSFQEVRGVLLPE